MQSKKYSALTPKSSRTRPKVLKIPNRSNHSSNNSMTDCTPHFKNIDHIKSTCSFEKMGPEHLKPPRYLPPLQPLMHSPRATGTFIFKKPKLLEQNFEATFRFVKNS
jgi:hypothetical protein